MAAPNPHGLFDEVLKRNTITDNGVTKAGRGVTCNVCKASTTKTSHEAWLAHVAAEPEDPGCGWARCKKQQECGTEEQRALWRGELLAKLKKKGRGSGSTGGAPTELEPPPPPQVK